MFELIRQLVNLYGATGREAGVADAVEALVKDHVDSIRRDALGNLICEKRGTDPDGKRIMLSAHMDHIGFIVVAVEKEGFLRVMPVGGVGLAVSRTRHVSFQNGVQGVIVQEPVREGETPAMKHMFIDIGAADETEALSMVSLGDVAVYANDCFRLGEHRVAAPAMDDRIACALLVSVMQALPQTRNTVIAVFSTQEEVGLPRRQDRRLQRGPGHRHRAGRDGAWRHAGNQAARCEAGRGSGGQDHGPRQHLQPRSGA